LAGSTGLAQARAAGTFTATHDAFWAAARTAHGDAAGTRALIEVLLLHRRMSHEAVLAGITTALQAGSSSPELVAIEARNAERPAEALLSDEDLTDADPGAAAEVGGGNVITLPARRPAIPEDTRPVPSVAAYDQLLSRRYAKGTA
jgi:hypothetical protein